MRSQGTAKTPISPMQSYSVRTSGERASEERERLILEHLPGRQLGKTAGDDEIRLQDQDIFRRAGKFWELAGLGGIPGEGRIARVGAQPEDLPGVGQGHQKLVGT